MFSGIIECVGVIENILLDKDCLKMTVSAPSEFFDLKVGDSVAINGICLTVTQLTNATFDVAVVKETLRLTNLALLTTGSAVNLERSLRVGDRIGGHYVQGHIDAVGQIISIHQDGAIALILHISIPSHLGKYIVNKGYITIDGMSITVIESLANSFSITLIPHTQAVTIAKNYQVGSKVNLEVDILGKYIEKIIGANKSCNPILSA